MTLNTDAPLRKASTRALRKERSGDTFLPKKHRHPRRCKMRQDSRRKRDFNATVWPPNDASETRLALFARLTPDFADDHSTPIVAAVCGEPRGMMRLLWHSRPGLAPPRAAGLARDVDMILMVGSKDSLGSIWLKFSDDPTTLDDARISIGMARTSRRRTVALGYDHPQIPR